MVGGLGLLAWGVIVMELLIGIGLAQKAAARAEQGFREDYGMQVCGRYLALAANMQAAVTTWRKMGCEGEDDVEPLVEEFLDDWRAQYPELDAEHCAQRGPLPVALHRERNPGLDHDYPNWVVKYE